MGKEYLKGLKDGLAGKIPIVAEATYKVTDTNIDPQHRQAQGFGRRRLHRVHHAEIRDHFDQRIAELGWKPLHFVRVDRQFVLGRASAGGSAKRGRRVVGGIPAGGEDAAGAGDVGVPRMERFHAALRPEREQGQRPGRPRLSGQQGDRSRS